VTRGDFAERSIEATGANHVSSFKSSARAEHTCGPADNQTISGASLIKNSAEGWEEKNGYEGKMQKRGARMKAYQEEAKQDYLKKRDSSGSRRGEKDQSRTSWGRLCAEDRRNLEKKIPLKDSGTARR